MEQRHDVYVVFYFSTQISFDSRSSIQDSAVDFSILERLFFIDDGPRELVICCHRTIVIFPIKVFVVPPILFYQSQYLEGGAL